MKHLLTGAAIALALATPLKAQDASTVLATVNGTEITLGHLVALRARLPEQYQQMPDEALYQGMLEQIIQQQALVDSIETTETDQLAVDNETRGLLANRAMERIAAEPVDDAAVQAAYDAQFGSAEGGTEYNASHILVETEEEAQAIAEEVRGGADFAEVARERSTGPSGPNGGELGWFGAGMMVPEFEEAVAGMEPGSVSDPIQTQFGWHVIRLNETRQQEAPSLDEVRAELEAQVQGQRLQEEVARLVSEADVTRSEEEIDPSVIRDDSLLGN